MRYIALALALCISLAPLEAATHKNAHTVKVKKNKSKGHKPPKHKNKTNHVN
jgi:hypothetical protein